MNELSAELEKVRQEVFGQIAKKHGFLVEGDELVLTDEQARREYGTPDSPPEPWLMRALRDG